MTASEEQITAVEQRFGVRLPDDYREFLRTRGSVDDFVPPAGDYLQIYPIDQMIGVNEAGEIQERFPGALVIGGDGSREQLAYDFRATPPPLVLLDISAADWSAAIVQASSLTSLLDRFPESGWAFE